jgi:diguanylate cyclase (GGDEF)-like protein
MGFVMKQLGTLTLALGIGGLGIGILALVIDAAWLGAVAGAAALVVGLLALRITKQSRRHTDDAKIIQDQLNQLEQTAANQIQARISAESEAAIADQRARKAELGTDMLADRLKMLRTRRADTVRDITDPLTGLYGEEFFTATVDSRVAAARRHLRPVSVTIIEAMEGVGSNTPHPADPVTIANVLLETIRESDTAYRLIDGRFALILDDTPENGAIWTIERFRRRIIKELPELTVWAGVAGYPAHAFDADTVVRLAEEALHAAHDWGRDRIEVAPTP